MKKIVLQGKAKLDIIKVLVSNALIGSYISRDDFVLRNVLIEYNEIKEQSTT